MGQGEGEVGNYSPLNYPPHTELDDKPYVKLSKLINYQIKMNKGHKNKNKKMGDVKIYTQEKTQTWI